MSAISGDACWTYILGLVRRPIPVPESGKTQDPEHEEQKCEFHPIHDALGTGISILRQQPGEKERRRHIHRRYRQCPGFRSRPPQPVRQRSHAEEKCNRGKKAPGNPPHRAMPLPCRPGEMQQESRRPKHGQQNGRAYKSIQEGKKRSQTLHVAVALKEWPSVSAASYPVNSFSGLYIYSYNRITKGGAASSRKIPHNLSQPTDNHPPLRLREE